MRTVSRKVVGIGTCRRLGRSEPNETFLGDWVTYSVACTPPHPRRCRAAGSGRLDVEGRSPRAYGLSVPSAIAVSLECQTLEESTATASESIGRNSGAP